MPEEKYGKSDSHMRHVEILAEIDTLSSLLDDLRARMRSDQRMLRDCGTGFAQAA